MICFLACFACKMLLLFAWLGQPETSSTLTKLTITIGQLSIAVLFQ
jgi:hypothetical protein